jgi:hypothetical protein
MVDLKSRIVKEKDWSVLRFQDFQDVFSTLEQIHKNGRSYDGYVKEIRDAYHHGFNTGRAPEIDAFIELQLEKCSAFELSLETKFSPCMDVGNYLRGLPNVFVHVESSEDVGTQHGRVVSLLVNHSNSCAVWADPVRLANRCAVIRGFMKLLEREGFSLRIMISNTTEGYVRKPKFLHIEVPLRTEATVTDYNLTQFLLTYAHGMEGIFWPIKDHLGVSYGGPVHKVPDHLRSTVTIEGGHGNDRDMYKDLPSSIGVLQSWLTQAGIKSINLLEELE